MTLCANLAPFAKSDHGIQDANPPAIALRQFGGLADLTQLKLELVRNASQITPPDFPSQSSEDKRKDDPGLKQPSKNDDYDG
jgi:hypothetical protein